VSIRTAGVCVVVLCLCVLALPERALAVRNEGKYLQFYWEGVPVSHQQPGKRSCLPFTDQHPKTFANNWLCVDPDKNIDDIGLQFINNGGIPDAVPSHKKCISLNKNDAPHVFDSKETIEDWADNYLCLPQDSHLEMFWSRATSTSNKYDCIEIYDKDWDSRFLCLRGADDVIDCQVGQWSAWDSCSSSCGEGTHLRTRDITASPNNGGAACPALVEKAPCKDKECGSAESGGQIVLWLLCLVVLIGEVLVCIVLVAPLPKGYRQKIIEKAAQYTDANKWPRFVVLGAAAFSLLNFIYSIVALRGLHNKVAAGSAGGRVDCHIELEWALLGDDYERDVYLSGFALFLLGLLIRVTGLLTHYMRAKAAAAGGPYIAPRTPTTGTTTTITAAVAPASLLEPGAKKVQ